MLLRKPVGSSKLVDPSGLGDESACYRLESSMEVLRARDASQDRTVGSAISVLRTSREFLAQLDLLGLVAAPV
jgi:hypothetical protein